MKTRNRMMLVFFWIACLVIALSLLFSPTLPVRAQQEPKYITVTGILGTADLGSITMTFPPAGGPVTGSARWDGSESGNEPGYGEYTCYWWTNWTFSGTFTGGDGGTVSGTYEQIGSPRYLLGKSPEAIVCGEGYNGTGTMKGIIHAIGYGPGGTQGYAVGTFTDAEGFGPTWMFYFSPEEFQAAMGPTVTPAVLDTPTPDSNEEVTDTPEPESTEEAGAALEPGSAGDCSSDPLNAEACMGTPFIKQGLVALISVGATLATILMASLAQTTAAPAASGLANVSSPADPGPMISLAQTATSPTAAGLASAWSTTSADPMTSLQDGTGLAGDEAVIAEKTPPPDTPVTPALIKLKADMEAINKKLADEKIYVLNKYQHDPIVVFDGLSKLGNLIWDGTAGQFTGSQGLTCEGYVNETKDPVRQAVAKAYPNAKVEVVAFEEKSSLHPEGVLNWLDARISDNHTLFKVTLPDKTELAVDFHQHNSPGNPPIVRDFNESRQEWVKALGKNEFTEKIRNIK